MRIDRDAPAIVVDGEISVLAQFDLDTRRVPGDDLVHRVVEDLGAEVMQRALVGAAAMFIYLAAKK
jgi:hypothetical protein